MRWHGTSELPSPPADGGDERALEPAAPLWPAVRMPLLLLAGVLVLHFSVWAYVSHVHGLPSWKLFNQWDSGHYTEMVHGRVGGVRRAFFPLYPGLVRAARNLLPGPPLPPQWVGTALSTACLGAFVVLAAAWRARSRDSQLPLAPRTGWGWLFFLLSPASYALHTHHTEGVFVLLSLVAFIQASRGHWFEASLVAGLGIWARNQGTLVALTVALLCAASAAPFRERVRRFALAGAVSFAFYVGFLGFRLLYAGDALSSFRAQRHWEHVSSGMELARTFWFGNPWQSLDVSGVLHHLFFLLLLGLSLLCWRMSRPLAVYGLLSLVPLLLQGHLGNSFRFGAVLFPLLFLAGDRLARLPGWVRLAVVGALLSLNVSVTLAYAKGHWAY